MDKKICALELASYLVRLDWTVYVSCCNYVDVTIHLDYLDVPRLQHILNSVVEVFKFTSFEFHDRSDISPNFYVCRCTF